ncbi:MAG TPA: acylneuraminate cytidylyltransferase family protein [Gemmatimonadales bacterium]|nr:acylneuraminate cytidylyltransferase family protein [Gemmatimonadales bacterium]
MPTTTLSAVAFVPARSGSKRVPDKNVRRLAGHPLLAYAIAGARASGVFSAVVCSTDSDVYADIARHYGAEVPCLRPGPMAGDLSPDIEWVEHMLGTLAAAGRAFDCFSIVRPTSPFRRAETIRRAWASFTGEPGVHSLRAVEKVTQHPGKMWVLRGGRLLPLMPASPADRPWHSAQYQALPEIFIQNASLEIAWTRVVADTGTIAGSVIVPFLTEALEGLDVNSPRDWAWAEELAGEHPEALPPVDAPPYP